MIAPAPRAIDEGAIARLRRFGGDKLICAIVGAFLNDAPTRVQLARHHADARDAAGVRRELHSLRSSAGQIGALSMQEWCAHGEELAADGFTPAIAAVVQHVEEELSIVREELYALRNGLQGNSAAA